MNEPSFTAELLALILSYMLDDANRAVWQSKTAELSRGLHEEIAELALRLRGGKQGLLRIIHALAVSIVLVLDESDVNRATRALQECYERGGSIENGKLIAYQLLADLIARYVKIEGDCIYHAETLEDTHAAMTDLSDSGMILHALTRRIIPTAAGAAENQAAHQIVENAVADANRARAEQTHQKLPDPREAG